MPGSSIRNAAFRGHIFSEDTRPCAYRKVVYAVLTYAFLIGKLAAGHTRFILARILRIFRSGMRRSISMKKTKSPPNFDVQNRGDSLAGAERFELSRTVLETAMLPLHHAPLSQRTYYSIPDARLSIISMRRVLHCGLQV